MKTPWRVRLAAWLLEQQWEKHRLWEQPDPEEVWFEWRFLRHYGKNPMPMDWDRLFAIWPKPNRPPRGLNRKDAPWPSTQM